MSDFVKRGLERARIYTESLARRFDVRLVMLFGSLVRGDWTESSDVDLLVIADELTDDPRENYVMLKEYGVEPVGIASRNALRELWRLNFVMLDALDYGRPLYRDEEFYQGLMKEFRRVKEVYGLERDEKGWRWSRGPPRSPEHSA